MRKMRCCYLLISLSFLVSPLLSQDAILYGTVTDGGLNEPLAFANVLIGDVNLGSTTELDGVYRIPNVPAGTYSVTFSYLGYESRTEEVTIVGGEENELNAVLTQGGVTMDEVVVRGQATGQRAAINQQINSNTIVNVVSKEKLQELPDQNAAEAVGRLAGVSVYRDAGEGQRISVRGISPRFNAITVNGERLPSTQESDRSVDLSMISPDMLAGIELFKAITPDMDGDAIGGTVNFTVAKADEGLRLQGRALTGYNDLKQDFGQYRGNFSVSNRFFGGKMGLIATANYQHANRSNEFIITDFVYQGIDVNDVPILSVENYNLGDKLETRNRYGGSLTLDYSINKNHTFLFNTSVGRTDRDEIRYRRRYRIGNNYQEFDINARQRKITLLANTLSGEHHLGAFDLTWRTSYSSSDQNTPNELRGRFREIGAIGAEIQDETDINSVASAFKHAFDNTIFYDSRFNNTKVNEDRITGQLDLRYNFNLGKKVNGFFKTGLKYRSVDRDRVRNGVLIRPYLAGNNPAVSEPEKFLQARGGQILMANFLGDYTNDGFYDGQYDILPGTAALRSEFVTPVEGVDINAYNNLFGTNYQLGDQVGYGGHIDINKLQSFYDAYKGDYQDDPFINSGDYNGKESIIGTYLMGSINLGEKITILGGARFEQTEQDYTSFRITGDQDDPDNPNDQIDVSVITRTAGKTYDELMPMFHFKYQAAPWMDVRLAATKTLARPNFFNIVPYEFINQSEAILQYGNPQLLHTTAWNYDAFFSFYNKFGLFTVGGFYKELRNIDFLATVTITDAEDEFKGYSLTEPRNITGISSVKGVEFDFQTNLSSLDNFLSGIVFGANLTVSTSKTFYPLFNVETVFVGPPIFFQTVVTDTLRGGSVVGQADLLSNITLGYERGGFSGRVSMIYQSDALSPGNPGIGSSESGVGEIPEKDFFDQGFYRFDLALKQKLDKKGKWTIMFNLNNFTNTPERAFLGIAERLRDEEFYGMTADLGVVFKIK